MLALYSLHLTPSRKLHNYLSQNCPSFAGFLLLMLLSGCVSLPDVDQEQMQSDLNMVEALMMDRQLLS